MVHVTFPLALPDADGATRAAATIVGQLDDYLLPRLARLDAPLLVVVGGSTGAGKSTLVNSLVRDAVSPAGVLRPTTRAPVLMCHPADAAWFTEAHLLPGLGRTHSPDAGGAMLRVVPVPTLGPGLALLDAPDIDSVVEANRVLAEQLLAAADLWLFVTTAARYADAVPWQVLRTARERGTAVALVLDRVPGSAADEIAPHLTEMMAEHGLGAARLFVLAEARLDPRGLLAEAEVATLRDWLGSLAASASARAAIVRQTVDGAILALGPSLAELAVAADHQVAAARSLAGSTRGAFDAAHAQVAHGIRDGELLHGEVLARWQELVGAGEFMRGLQARIGVWRNRVVAAVTGRPDPADQFAGALESGLVTLIRAAAADAAEQTAIAWRAQPGGAERLGQVPGSPSPELPERAERMIRDWQRAVLELVRTEAGSKRIAAKVGAYAVNALGLAVMIAVFAATAFIPTGAEIAVAGGTTLAAQKVLEAIFGDQAVRELAGLARIDLLDRVRALLDAEARRFLAVLDLSGVDAEAAQRLRRAAALVETARSTGPGNSPGPAR